MCCQSGMNKVVLGLVAIPVDFLGVFLLVTQIWATKRGNWIYYREREKAKSEQELMDELIVLGCVVSLTFQC